MHGRRSSLFVILHELALRKKRIVIPELDEPEVGEIFLGEISSNEK
jgi:hypothetical protein